LAVRVPVAVYELLMAAEEKIGRVLEVDLVDESKRPASLITVWEAIAQLVNDTDETRLKLEIEGDCDEHAHNEALIQGGPSLDQIAARSGCLPAS